MTPVDDDRAEMVTLCGVDIGNDRICPRFKPCPTHDPVGELLEEVATTPPNPDGSVTLRAPANDAGRVDFSEMLRESWQPIARDRLNAVLGRPYLSTQLTALLPADVCLRLTERLEALIHEAVQLELDKLHDELDTVTAATLARLAAQADSKLEELKRERFSSHPATRWGG